MKTALFVIALSGLSALTASIDVEYHYVKEPKTWDEARRYCRERFTDLATVGNQGDHDRLRGVLRDPGENAWIGLYDDMTGWVWTQENAGTDMFTYWRGDEPNNKNTGGTCVTMTSTGHWRDTSCETPRPAICYNEPGPAKYIVTTEMTWAKAREYCRTTYTDLVTVRNQSENNLITSLTTTLTWIGLQRKTWVYWSDQTPRTFSQWAKTQPYSNGPMKTCVAVNTTTGKWWDVDCNTKISFICHSVPPERHTTMLKLTFQSEADLNDPALQLQILEQLQTKLEKHGLPDLKLRWVKRDGQTFHKEPKEKKEEVPCG